METDCQAIGESAMTASGGRLLLSSTLTVREACIFDNTGDGDFYKTSTYLAELWPQLGNPSESHFASGGHCQNIPYADIVTCLDIGGSSQSMTVV